MFNKDHLTLRIVGEYLWLWIAALASIVLYSPLALMLNRGWVAHGGDPNENIAWRILV
jgi:hypothetical protein